MTVGTLCYAGELCMRFVLMTGFKIGAITGVTGSTGSAGTTIYFFVIDRIRNCAASAGIIMKLSAAASK